MRVLLARGDDWPKIPPELQARIESGVERIRAIRDMIGGEARVRLMPPVTVDPAGWGIKGKSGLVYATAGAWRSNTGHSLGVITSAVPALSEEEAAVRALLVHEFAHCFQLARIIIDHLDLGTGLELMQGDATDEVRENKLLVDPKDWFGPTDQELMRWGDERLTPAAQELLRHMQAGHVPFTAVPLTERAHVTIPPEWAEHIRKIRRGEA
jgi:hypothetical protein